MRFYHVSNTVEVRTFHRDSTLIRTCNSHILLGAALVEGSLIVIRSGRQRQM